MKKMSTLLVVFFLFTAFSYGQASREIHFKGRSFTGLRHFFNVGAHHFYLLSQDYNLKNALNRQKQKLDSIVLNDTDTEDNEKITFHYDALGNLSEYADWEIGDKGDWTMDFKTNFFYTAKGKLDSTLFFAPDSLGKIIPVYIEKYFYTAGGKIDRLLGAYYNTDNEKWIWSEKVVFNYDSSGRLVARIQYYNNVNQTTDKTTADWFQNGKITYSYDTLGNLVLKTEYLWNLDKWVADTKTEYTFSNRKVTEQVESFWNSASGSWSNSHKYDYSYDGQERFVREIDYAMLSGESDWTKRSLVMLKYDSVGNFGMETDYQWDAARASWHFSAKTIFSYDNTYSFSDLVLPVYVLADLGGVGNHSSNKSAAQSEKTNESFDPADDVEPVPADFRLYFVHMWISAIDYDWNTTSGSWAKTDKISLYYSKFDVTGVHKTKIRHLEILPNPASGYITVTLPRQDARNFLFELFDVQGRKVLSEKVANHARINLQYLQNGVYFYRAVFRGEKYSGKILKK